MRFEGLFECCDGVCVWGVVGRGVELDGEDKCRFLRVTKEIILSRQEEK